MTLCKQRHVRVVLNRINGPKKPLWGRLSVRFAVVHRHPSNLMLDRLSGKIIHIDFGDCFEVAMTREKFPEKIPFRLTRMLINAMEVHGTL